MNRGCYHFYIFGVMIGYYRLFFEVKSRSLEPFDISNDRDIKMRKTMHQQDTKL